MAKKVMTVTNIKAGSDPSDYYPFGTELDLAKFTKEQLSQLHDAGAIIIVDNVSVEEIQATVTSDVTSTEETPTPTPTPEAETTKESKTE